ncbi:hypothetical protein [Phocaeicola sp.]
MSKKTVDATVDYAWTPKPLSFNTIRVDPWTNCGHTRGLPTLLY